MRRGCAIWLLVLSSHVFGQTQNADSGIGPDQCYRSGSNKLVACSGTDLLRQDGHLGRDVSFANDADGRLGFAYRKVCNSGESAGAGTCPLDPALGEGHDDWGCTLDQVDGVMFEVKQATGPRAGSLLYTNYNSKYDPLGLKNASTNTFGYLAMLNSMQLCGASDWVFEHVTKVHTLVNYGGTPSHQSMLDPVFFPNTAAGLHWTSSDHPFPTSQAWMINLRKGSITHADDRSEPHHILANRKVNVAVDDRRDYDDSGREVVDRNPYVRAIWQRCVVGMGWDGTNCIGEPLRLTHEQALVHAAEVAAQTGLNWRVPNVKELTWLVERSNRHPAISTAPFPATPPEACWTSTPFVPAPRQAWIVNFDFGVAEPLPRSTAAVVRLVRSVE